MSALTIVQRISGRTAPLLGVAGLLAVASLAGCASSTKLYPASDAGSVPGRPWAAVREVGGIRFLAEPNRWTGLPEVAQQVTPIWVTVENDGDRPLRLRYSDFVLTTPEGKVYAALPPYLVDGEVRHPVLARTYAPIPVYHPKYHNFYVAPPYGAVYPGVPVWEHDFYYDPWYYDHYYTYWESVRMPTEEMLNRALLEGVVERGGSASGFLYFEHVDPDDVLVRFRADLFCAGTGQRCGSIMIPFTVEEEKAELTGS